MNSSSAAIGILGDGQLAMMLGESAHRRSIPFIGFGKDPDSSFAKRFPDQFKTDFSPCKSFTLENEFLSSAELSAIETKTHTPVCPKPTDYHHFENKIAQRR